MPKRSLLVSVVILLGLTLLACGGWGCASAADQYEPNDDLQAATPLVAGTTLQASIDRGGPSGDSDVFQCDVSEPDGLARFRVEVESERSEDLEVEVGASIPEAFEAISWPGWEAQRDGDVIVVRGELKAGTVLIFISGTRSVDYSIRVVWE